MCGCKQNQDQDDTSRLASVVAPIRVSPVSTAFETPAYTGPSARLAIRPDQHGRLPPGTALSFAFLYI